MLPTTIHEAPALDSFTPLADHQSQTPTTFFDAKPVLHYHYADGRVLVSHDSASRLPMFSQAVEGNTDTSAVAAAIYISSENVTLFNTATTTGVAIPYPAISLHALQTSEDSPQADTPKPRQLYMQLEFCDVNGGDDEEDPEILELSLLGMPDEDMQKLYDAVSNCSNLHPDPNDDGDEEMEDGGDSRIMFEGSVGYEGISGLPGVQRGAVDGSLPPPFPGSGGWITAENVSEYFDEGGNWIGEGNGESLGEGAGRVRSHDEVVGVNGEADTDADDSKRPRTD